MRLDTHSGATWGRECVCEGGKEGFENRSVGAKSDTAPGHLDLRELRTRQSKHGPLPLSSIQAPCPTGESMYAQRPAPPGVELLLADGGLVA